MTPKIYRIKPRQLNTWKSWGKTLMTQYRKEAEQSLKKEHTELEFFITFKIDRHWYSIGAQLGDFIPAAPSKLNAMHKAKIHQCLTPITAGETTYLLRG